MKAESFKKISIVARVAICCLLFMSLITATEIVSAQTIEQEGFRWRNDDGNETAASWLAPQDTQITQEKETNVRLRILLNATGDPASQLYRLDYKLSTDSVYTAVATSAPGTATVTYENKGTWTGNVFALTVPVPTGYQDGDLFMLFVESANESIATPTGWTEVANSPQATGTPAANSGIRLAVFYKVVSGSQSSVTVADSGDHTTAIIANFRGVDNENPIDITSGSVESVAVTAMSMPSLTTTVNNAMIVHGVGINKDLGDTDTISGASNPNFTVTEQHDQTMGNNQGGGLAFFTGTMATAGHIGTTTATADSATLHAYVTVALRPAATSPKIHIVNSSFVTNGGATTAQLSAPSGKTTSNFDAGQVLDTSNAATEDLCSGCYTELEWSITASQYASNGETYQFRVTKGGVALDTYSVTPTWTIGSLASSPATRNALLKFKNGFIKIIGNKLKVY